MIAVEPISLSFGTALLLGLSFGAGPCNIACLPYLGPVFLATGRGIAGSRQILLPFSLGRIFGYVLVAASAGAVGSLVQKWLESPWVHWVLGSATIGVALSLMIRRRCTGGNKSCSTPTRSPGKVPFHRTALSASSLPMPSALFAMGMGMALNPCAPLSMIMVSAAATASISAGVWLGIGFGLGAVAIPILVFALGIAHFSNQLQLHLRQWRGALETASVFMLLGMGIATAAGWLSP